MEVEQIKIHTVQDAQNGTTVLGESSSTDLVKPNHTMQSHMINQTNCPFTRHKLVDSSQTEEQSNRSFYSQG